MEQVMGVEPTLSAWKAEVIAVIPHLHIILLATAPCTSASTPVNRNDAGKVPWKATLCSAVFKYHLSGDSEELRYPDLQRDRLAFCL